MQLPICMYRTKSGFATSFDFGGIEDMCGALIQCRNRAACGSSRIDPECGHSPSVGIGLIKQPTLDIQHHIRGESILPPDEMVSFTWIDALRKWLHQATSREFVIQGSLSSPTVKLKRDAAGSRAVAETVTLPLHILNALLGGGRPTATGRVPCATNNDGSVN